MGLTLLLMEIISVFDAAVEGSTGFGVMSEAPPNAFHRMVSLGEIANGGGGLGGFAEFALMFGGELNVMCAMLKEEAVVSENTQGTLTPPMTGSVETL